MAANDKHIIQPSTLRQRLILAFAASVVAMGVTAYAGEPRYRLLLGIVVEGLDADGLELLQDKLGSGGFMLLNRNGISIRAADYGTPLDVAAATTTLVSGAQPAVSGIDGETNFDRERLLFSHIFSDASVSGRSTRSSYSPAAIRVSTLSDEARISGAGMSVVYAIAPTASQAIPLGGHAANVVLWIDPATANWSSSSFYNELPTVVSRRNRIAPLSTRMDTMSWTPLGGAELYTMLPEHLSRYGFHYVFSRGKAERIDMFMASPLVNSEVTDVACDLITAGKLGTHSGGIDVLNIGYNLTGFPYGTNADKRLEKLDATMRLDRNLEQLFKAVDKAVGLDSTLIYLAGTPARPFSPRDDEQWKIPYGQFSAKRAVSLLNMYLIALYGNGDYVSAFRAGKLYLNRQTIKDKNLDITQVRSEVATFLTRMNGVGRAYTLEAVAAGYAGENAEAIRRNTVAATAPDVTMTVSPGFELLDDYKMAVMVSVDQLPYVWRDVTSAVPVFIMAPGIEARCIDTPVDVRAIAPAITRLLRIRSPNGAAVPPLRL